MIAPRVSDEMPTVVAASPTYLARRGTPKKCRRTWRGTEK